MPQVRKRPRSLSQQISRARRKLRADAIRLRRQIRLTSPDLLPACEALLVSLTPASKLLSKRQIAANALSGWQAAERATRPKPARRSRQTGARR